MVIGLARCGARSGSGLQWLLHFSEWQHSGVSLHAFCRSRRLSYRAARAWQLKLARTVLGRRNPGHPSNRLANSLTEAGAEPPSGSRILDQDDRWMSKQRALNPQTKIKTPPKPPRQEPSHLQALESSILDDRWMSRHRALNPENLPIPSPEEFPKLSGHPSNRSPNSLAEFARRIRSPNSLTEAGAEPPSGSRILDLR